MNQKWNLTIVTPDRDYTVTAPGSSFEDAVNRLDEETGFVFFKDKVSAHPTFSGAEKQFNAVAISRNYISSILDNGPADAAADSSVVEL